MAKGRDGGGRAGTAGPPPLESAQSLAFTPRREGVPPELLGLVIGLGLHAAVLGGLARIHPGAWTNRIPQNVEMEVVEKPPPPLPVIEEPKPEPPPPPKPGVGRRVVAKAPAPPPPPNQEPPPTPPPDEPPPPPTFGVTMDS